MVDTTMNIITIKDIAMMFGISMVTAWRWVRTEGLPNPRKIGKRFYFDKDEILSWWEYKGKQGEAEYHPWKRGL